MLPQEAQDFQRVVTEYVHEAEILQENVYVADEISMWSDPVPLRTRIDPATMDAGIVRDGNNRRDTSMVALSAAGQIDATFLPHQR
jgi:glutathione synthase/RimK-type ligase-like ATP-grasp enzyme